MRLNFFAIYKKSEKMKKLKPCKPTFPIGTGVALALSLLLLLTSCRTSACIFLLHQGPLPPPCQVAVLATPRPTLLLIVRPSIDVIIKCFSENFGDSFNKTNRPTNTSFLTWMYVSLSDHS